MAKKEEEEEEVEGQDQVKKSLEEQQSWLQIVRVVMMVVLVVLVVVVVLLPVAKQTGAGVKRKREGERERETRPPGVCDGATFVTIGTTIGGEESGIAGVVVEESVYCSTYTFVYVSRQKGILKVIDMYICHPPTYTPRVSFSFIKLINNELAPTHTQNAKLIKTIFV